MKENNDIKNATILIGYSSKDLFDNLLFLISTAISLNSETIIFYYQKR